MRVNSVAPAGRDNAGQDGCGAADAGVTREMAVFSTQNNALLFHFGDIVGDGNGAVREEYVEFFLGAQRIVDRLGHRVLGQQTVPSNRKTSRAARLTPLPIVYGAASRDLHQPSPLCPLFRLPVLHPSTLRHDEAICKMGST